jgi:hypothetical protein
VAEAQRSEPRRVVVTSPRRRAARAARRPVSVEIDEQTLVGEVYVRSLVRAQLRLGLVVAGGVLGALFVLPLLFRLEDVRAVRVVGVPLPWLVLGVLVYPLILGAAVFYVRQAERLEREFVELVTPPDSR